MVHVLCISWRQYPFSIRQNSWIHISHGKLFYKKQLNMNLGPDKFIHGRLYNKKRVYLVLKYLVFRISEDGSELYT